MMDFSWSHLGLLEVILFEPIWIYLVLGFGQSPFQVSENLNMMQDDDAMTSKAKLGLWQLTPTKQKSRPEI